MGDVYVHNEIKEEVDLIKKRIDALRQVSSEISNLDISPEEKKNLLNQLKEIRNKQSLRLGDYIVKGLICFI